MAPVRGSLRFTLTRPAVQVTAIRSDPLPPVTVSSDPLTEARTFAWATPAEPASNTAARAAGRASRTSGLGGCVILQVQGTRRKSRSSCPAKRCLLPGDQRVPDGEDGLVVEVDGLLAERGDLVRVPVALPVVVAVPDRGLAEVQRVLDVARQRPALGAERHRAGRAWLPDLVPAVRPERVDVPVDVDDLQYAVIAHAPTPGVRWARSRAHLGPDRTRALLALALVLAGRADQDRDLAEVLVLVEELVRFGHAVEAHHAPEDRLDLALGHQLVRSHALIGVGEVRADDLLLTHPEVADVEVERVAGGRAADHHLAEWLHDEDRGREGRLADVLEDDVG